MKRLVGVTMIAVALAITACGVESTPFVVDPELPDPGVSTQALVGAEGGSVQLGNVAVEIPADALAQETTIGIVVEDSAAPSAFHAYSPVLRFEPAGQVFERPVTVTIPYQGDAETATIFWTSAGSQSYMALPTTVANGLATAQVTHFSEAFVGTGCAGDDCCDRSNGELDILLVVDNSNSMSEEQAALAEQLPRMAEVLATGDLDGDGEQDFPALQSVRVGVVTSDMGTGGYTIQTCEEPMTGDNGVLQTAPGADSLGCDASYPSYAELSADADPAAIEGFVDHVRCVGVAGTGGCGFEQQLEASYSAVTVQTGAGMPNAGFLRDDSLVAVVVMTDEDDCSTGNAEMFNPSRDDLGALNVRCALNPGELYPSERYSAALQGLRSDPQDVIFALVAGVPVDLVADPEAVDLDAVLADPRMEPQVEPENPNELVRSCDTSIGVAYPPRRLVETAAAFGANAVVQSICQDDFTPVIGAILSRVASRARGECL